MAIRTVAQAAADIRLSDAKANQDFEKIRRDLIQKATRLEADMAISIAVTVDQNSLRSVATGLSRLQQSLPSLVVPVTANTDKVLADIIALTTLDLVVEVPVTANIEPAQSDIAGLQGADTVIELPVTVNADQALSEIIALTEIDAVIRIPVEVERPKASEITPQIPVSGFPTGPTSFSLQADVTDARAQIESFIAALPPVVLRVLPDTDTIVPAVEAVDIPPIEVPVTAAGVGPGIAVSPGLARFREEMAALEQEGVLLRVLGDTTDAEAKIGALGGGDPPDPITIPVVSDTTGFVLPGGPNQPPEDPVVVPVVVDVDQFLADLARITSGGGGGGGGGNIPPVVVPVTANTVPAQTQVRAFGSDVEQQSQTHGDRAGSAFGRGFSAAATGVMATAAITLGGVLASSLIEGFQRFTTIQDSTESLTVALQSATEAASLLGDVLNVVRGTPFRLDDFARAATNMVSFGVAAEKVPLFLTAIGEAAATRGSQANQFAQSLSTIYGQIQAIGRINGEDVWQFGNVGVDVLRILGNTMDKTTEDVRKMISEGAVTSEFALDAITQGILHGTEGINGATVAFSGTMERLGDTLSGSIENFGAARARFGVAIIRPLSDTMIAGFKSFTAVIDDFAARVEPLFEGLADSPLIEGLNNFFENAPDLIQPTIDALEDLGPALAPIGIAIGALGLGALGAVLGPFGALIPGITSLTGALTVFGASAALLSPEIREVLIPTLKELGEVGAEIGGTLVEGIGQGIEGVAPVVVRALGVLRDIGPEVETLFTQAFGSIGELGPKITPILDSIITFAEEALPVAFEAASQAIAAVTGVVDAALPVVNQLVLAATDLVPAFSVLLDVTEGVGEVLIPVLSTVGELIGDLPVGVLQTLLGVFLGFKAVSFFQTQVAGISKAVGGLQTNLQGASLSFAHFRDQGQSSLKAVQSTVSQFTKSGSVAQSFGIAVAGAFSGIALASEDMATRVTGAVGVVGSVLTGFATGGIIGGSAALIGTGIGLIAASFIDAKKEAEAFKDEVNRLAAALEGLTEPEIVAELGETLKEDLRKALGDIDIGDLPFLENFDLAAIVTERLDTGEVDVQNVIDQIFGNLKIDPTVFDQTFAGIEQKAEAFNVSTSDIFTNLGDTIDDLKVTQNTRDFTFGDSDPLKQDLIDLIAGLESLQAQLEAAGIDSDALGKVLDVLTDSTSGFNEMVAQADVSETWKTGGEAAEEAGDKAEEAGEKAETAAEAAARATQEYKDLLLEEGVTFEELQAQAKLLGEETVDAADRASEAWERFGNVLDAVKSKMDLTVQTQNLDQDMRDLGDTLDDVINTEDIKKADKIGEDIVNVEKRIADLKVRLADETAQGDIIRADLDRRIAFSAARGFDEVVAALQAERDLSFDDAQKVQRDIDEQIAQIAELRGQLDGLVTTPITMFQALVQQAAEANMSMFAFLLAGPTPEAQAVFQNGMVDTVNAAIARATLIGQTDPLGGQAAAEEFRTQFRDNLLATGFDPATANALIENLWPTDLLAAGAQEAATKAFEDFNAQIETDMAADPTTMNIAVELADLGEQRAALEAFQTEHPEVVIPMSLAEIDQAILDLIVEDTNERIAIRQKQLAEAAAVEQVERFGGPAAVQRAFPTEQESAEKAMKKVFDAAQAALNLQDPLEMKAAIVEVEQMRDDVQKDLDANPEIKLPAGLTIESVDLIIDEANKQAILGQFKDIVPTIFGGNADLGAADPVPHQTETSSPLVNLAVDRLQDIIFGNVGRMKMAEGGVLGYDEPHTAQIAHGYRIWAEPETGGEAYLPLGMNKRVSAMGVFMKVAEIFDLDVRPRKEVPTLFDINVPEIRIPEMAKMFQAADARSQSADIGTAVRNAMVDAMHAVRRPVTQEDLERNVVVERIEKLVIGPGETSRKRASEFIREMRLRAARL